MLCRNGRRGFDEAFCYGAYEGTLRKLIHLYQIQRHAAAGRNPWRRCWPTHCRGTGNSICVTPVPLHWRRQWQRGFNQSELLGKADRDGVRGIPASRVLRRVAATRAQAGLSNARRRENVAGAFRARRRVAGAAGSADRRCDDYRRDGGGLRAGA